MSKMQRTKGAAAERELARLIDEHLGVRLERNLSQSRSGGHDLTLADPEDANPVARALAGFAIECKRHSRATPGLLRQWWRQAVEQAQRASMTPVLAYREDRADWRLIVPLATLCPTLGVWDDIELTADVSLPAFAALVREAAG